MARKQRTLEQWAEHRRRCAEEERRQRVMVITEFDARDRELTMHAMATEILKYRKTADERQVRLLKGQIDDRRFDLVRDLVPDPPRSRLAIHQSFDPALLVSAVPVVERRSRDPDWSQCPTDRERRLLHQFDDLELLGCGIPHEASSPSPRTLFLSRRLSIRTSARVSLSWRASALSSLTSSEVASRAASPASRFLPASRNSFDQR